MCLLGDHEEEENILWVLIAHPGNDEEGGVRSSASIIDSSNN